MMIFEKVRENAPSAAVGLFIGLVASACSETTTPSKRVVAPVPQAPVAVAADTLQGGGTIIPAISGGSGTGAWHVASDTGECVVMSKGIHVYATSTACHAVISKDGDADYLPASLNAVFVNVPSVSISSGEWIGTDAGGIIVADVTLTPALIGTGTASDSNVTVLASADGADSVRMTFYARGADSTIVTAADSAYVSRHQLIKWEFSGRFDARTVSVAGGWRVQVWRQFSGGNGSSVWMQAWFPSIPLAPAYLLLTKK